MKLRVLGCGDAFGSGGRNHSGYLLESGERGFLLDCGPATLSAMQRAGLSPQRVEAILLSHLHGDHCGGVPFFLLDALYQHPRSTPLRIAGPPGTEERIGALFQLMFGDPAEPRRLPALFSVLEPGRPQAIGELEVFPFRVPHQVREVSLGLKIGLEGKRLLYSGDSAWTDEFVAQSEEADLFLCECCFYDRQAPNHMSYRTLQENLPRLKCKDLIVTHLGEEMLARRAELAVKAAEDGMVIEI